MSKKQGHRAAPVPSPGGYQELGLHNPCLPLQGVLWDQLVCSSTPRGDPSIMVARVPWQLDTWSADMYTVQARCLITLVVTDLRQGLIRVLTMPRFDSVESFVTSARFAQDGCGHGRLHLAQPPLHGRGPASSGMRRAGARPDCLRRGQGSIGTPPGRYVPNLKCFEADHSIHRRLPSGAAKDLGRDPIKSPASARHLGGIDSASARCHRCQHGKLQETVSPDPRRKPCK